MKSKKVLSMVTVLAMCTSMLVMPQANAEGETIYTSANGWTLNGSIEQQDGSLAIVPNGNNPTVFSPELEYGKKYSITYDVTGLTTGSNSWNYPFRIKLSAGSETVDGPIAYRMAGRWAHSGDTLIATGTNGTNEIIYDTVTGDWATYALGSFGTSGTFADPSGFAIKFYRYQDDCQAYISNVTVTDITPEIYNSANGWSLAPGATETANGELTMVKGVDSWFTPELESGKRYEISYYFDYQGTGESGTWNKPFQMTLADDDETISDPITYYRTTDGLWATANGKWSYGVNSGKQGTVKVYIDTATGEWSTDIFGSDGPASGSSYGNGAVTLTKFNAVSGFKIGFRCQQDSNPVTYPTYISNVTVTDITNAIYNAANGWTLNGSEEQQDGSLAIKTDGNNPTVFSPALEYGKKYSITYDVTGLTTGSNSWNYPFRIKLSAGSETVDGPIAYRMAGRWAHSGDTLIANGTNGTNEIIFDTVSGKWETYALGSAGASGTFADPSGFAIRFYRYQADCQAYISNVTVTDVTNKIYNEANGWTLNGSEEQQDGSLAIKAGGNTPTVYRPVLESGKKYSITYDVTGLETTSDSNNLWAYPFRVKLTAGSENKDGALGYRMSGTWESGDNSKTGTNGTNEIVIDTGTGEWKTYALGKLAYSGTFADTSDFAINFYRWSALCQAYISNVTVTDITPVIYNSANGWTLGDDAAEVGTSLKIGKAETKFMPTLESGNEYAITFNVDVPDGIVSGSWKKPIHISLYAGGTSQEVMFYYLLGKWSDSTRAANYGDKGDGTVKVTVDTVTGDWSIDAPGEGTLLTGTFTAPVTDFGIGFCEKYEDPAEYPVYISKVAVDDASLGSFTPTNGWTLGDGAAVQQDGSLKLAKTNYSWFAPELESGKTYEISYDVDVTVGGDNIWAKPFQMTVADNDETFADILNCYCSTGVWADGSRVGYGVEGTSGTVKVLVDTETGDWSVDIFGTGNGPSGTFTDVSDFKIGFRCEQYLDPATYPSYISNVTVTDKTQGGAVSGSWTLGEGASVQQDGSLKLAKTNYSWYTPVLESGKIYEISYDVDVTVGGESIWAKPFQMTVADSDETFETILNCYCTAGVWADNARVAYGVEGTSGNIKVNINTETGAWSVDIFGSGAGPTGTFEDVSGFKLGFRCEPYVDPATYPSYVSNVVVTEKEKEPEPPFTGTYYEQDFDSLSSTAILTNPSATHPFRLWEGELITDGNEKYLATSLLDMYPINLTPATGKYVLEFDVKPKTLTYGGTNWDSAVMQFNLGSTNSDAWHDMKIGSSAGASMTTTVAIDKLWLFGNSMTIDPSEWVHVELIYDCAMSTVTGRATQGANYVSGTAATTVETDPTSYRGTPKITFEALTVNSAKYDGVYVDNFKVSAKGESIAPVLSKNDIKIYKDDTEQKAAAVSAFSDKIEITFGQEMWPDDMSVDHIYVINTGTNENVEYTKGYSEGTYTLNFADGFVGDRTYKLHIDRVRNIAGIYTDEPYELDFKTVGGVSAEIVSVTQNNTEINSLSALTVGAAKVNVKYSNTTDTAPQLHLIVSYYSGTKLVRTNYIKWATSAENKSVNYSLNVTIPQIDESYDKVQFMVWDGFNSMRPLGDNKELN